MKRLEKTAIALLSVAALSALPGCILVAAAALGAAGAAYVNGELEGRLDGSPQQVVRASERALKDMDIQIISADATGIDGKVVGRTALDKKIEISVKRDGDESSKIAIRVDTFGDESLSRQIYDKIKTKM
jgi:hypothetical protein